jgi:hypothetical protein
MGSDLESASTSVLVVRSSAMEVWVCEGRCFMGWLCSILYAGLCSLLSSTVIVVSCLVHTHPIDGGIRRCRDHRKFLRFCGECRSIGEGNTLDLLLIRSLDESLRIATIGLEHSGHESSLTCMSPVWV